MDYKTVQSMRKQAWSLFGKRPAQQPIDHYNNANARRVRQIIAQQLALNDDEVHDSQTWQDLNADDLDRIEAIMALEERFRRQYSDEDYEKAKTVGDMVSLFSGGTYTKPSPIKLNKAQEAIMANAGQYRTSNDLLTALESAEDASDLLGDLKQGASKLGYTAHIRVPKKASYTDVQRMMA